MLMPCEHVFCVSCIVPKVEGKEQKTTTCPECLANVNQIVPSKKQQKLTESLSLTCAIGCGKTFNICDMNRKLMHQEECAGKIGQSHSSSLTQDILELDIESDISKELEETAVKVIRHKISKSTLPNKAIEFMTGGSRVCLLILLTPMREACRMRGGVGSSTVL